MGTIIVKNHVSETLTNDSGRVIFNLIYPQLKAFKKVAVSFENVYSVSTSFIDAAFIDLLDHFSFDHIKTYLKLIQCTGYVSGMIKKQMNSVYDYSYKDKKPLAN